MIEDKLNLIQKDVDGFEPSSVAFPWLFAEMAEDQLVAVMGYEKLPGAPTSGKFPLNYNLEDGYMRQREVGGAIFFESRMGIMNLNVASDVEYPEVIGISLNANWKKSGDVYDPEDWGYVILHDPGIIQVGLIPNALNRASVEDLVEPGPPFPKEDFNIGLWLPDDYTDEETIYNTLHRQANQATQSYQDKLQLQRPGAIIETHVEEDTLLKLTEYVNACMNAHRNANS